MRLFIAEKPSLARAIAEVLPSPHKRSPTHIECGDGNTVAWCAGHILETAPPEAYSADYSAWRLEHLPIVPKEWKLEVSAPALVKSLESLLRRAKRVVHAGDPDREGQLLVDEVLLFLGYRGPVDRILIRDLRPDAVRRALAEIQPNASYRGLYASALARQRADWLFGMNMTRLYTLLGRSSGHDGVLSVGRVQTPVLGLIVERDLAIERFQPVPYYALTATLHTADGVAFPAQWRPGPSVGLDPPEVQPVSGQPPEAHAEEKKILRREIAESVQRRCHGSSASVAEVTEVPKKEEPPLPYSLAALQMDAGKRLGLSAQDVLDACQSLYERHRLATYPRSDCSQLPEGHLAQASAVAASIAKHAPALSALATKADLTLRSKAWNDKKITAHHAIVPTPNVNAAAQLSEKERGVYELLCRRYLAQFYPAHESVQTKVELTIGGETFVARGRVVRALGWKAVTGNVLDDPKDNAHATLPRLTPGDAVAVTELMVVERQTQPPAPFTDASLIEAMCNVARFVTTPSVRKILTETDGIGTPATRASIIEVLLERGYLTRPKRTLRSTPTGRALIQALPPVATTPDMTAVWEAAMRAITDGEQSLDDFLARVTAQLTQLIEQGRRLGTISVPVSTARAAGRRGIAAGGAG